MSKFQHVIQILEAEGCAPYLENQSYQNDSWQILKWAKDDDEHYIFEGDITIEGKDIAWFQSSSQDNHLLRVIQNNNKFEWIPKTYNPVFGCHCVHIEWYKNHVLFVYQEKHDLYVCSVQETNIKTFCIEGEELERQGNLLAYETFQNKLEDHVRLIELPSLKELTPITKEEAKIKNLLPKDLNRPDGFLSDRTDQST